jgi:cytochrome c-type biogenesis protein CcmE
MTDVPPTPPAPGHGLEEPARAPRPPGPRLRYWVAGLLCAGAVVYLVFFGLGSNIVYFRSVSEVVARRDYYAAHRVRIAGQVVKGSVREQAGGVDFDITDGGATVHVHHTGDEPSLFKEDTPVVCEGKLQGDAFLSERILIKHGSNYTPPVVTTR